MRALNLGILAHIDAGKTSLTERLLFDAGVIDAMGSVDRGNTQTDTMALERQRGITIRSAVASFVANDVTINLIDTPGHPDFIAEVERTLACLDAVVLVVSAVEGVQAQTRVLMRTLQRLRIPTIIFVNKIDRMGADPERVVAGIAERLTPAIVPMQRVVDAGERGAGVVAFDQSDKAFVAELAEALAENDAALLEAVIGDRAPPYCELQEALARQTSGGMIHPVFFGSAVTGAGIGALMAGIAGLLPVEQGDAAAELSGIIFKIDRGAAGEKIAYVRLFSGSLHARERLHYGAGHDEKVTAISVFDRGWKGGVAEISAGQIGQIRGLVHARVGDSIGRASPRRAQNFAPPALETRVSAQFSRDRAKLWVALGQLAEQDPLINLRKDDSQQEMFISLYGEVQKEVIGQILLDDFHVAAIFDETRPICIERPAGIGEAVDRAPDPFIATIGLTLEPGEIDTGVAFRIGIEFGYLPMSYYTAIEEAVREALAQGLHGWAVTDCVVTMTEAIRIRDWGPSTNAAEHRKLAPLVVMDALRQAGTVVCAPINQFRLEIPVDGLTPVLGLLARLGASAEASEIGAARCTISGNIAAFKLHDLGRQLPGLTHGEGMLESSFSHYEPVQGVVPERRRTGINPLSRSEYLRGMATGEY